RERNTRRSPSRHAPGHRRESVACGEFVFCAGSAVLRLELQRRAIDAIAPACRVAGAIGEDMTEMAFAAGTAHFGAAHEKGTVVVLRHGGLGGRLVEAWPAGPGIELGAGCEQGCRTGRAQEGALALLAVEGRGAGPLGPVLAQDVVLLRRQLGTPRGIALDDLVGALGG